MKSVWKLVGFGSLSGLLLAAPQAVRAGDYGHSPHSSAIVVGVATAGSFAASASGPRGHFEFSFSNWRDRDRYERDHCEPQPRWIAGHYEIERQNVRIPGYWDVIHEPAQYGYEYRCGRRVRVMLKPACTRRVKVPARWEWQETKVWVPGHWAAGESHARAY